MGADVLRMNSSAKNPPQRKAAARYRQGYETRTNKETVDNLGIILTDLTH